MRLCLEMLPVLDFPCAKFPPLRLTLSQNLNFLHAPTISRFKFRGSFIGSYRRSVPSGMIYRDSTTRYNSCTCTRSPQTSRASSTTWRW
jgi:hypothetical protein